MFEMGASLTQTRSLAMKPLLHLNVRNHLTNIFHVSHLINSGCSNWWDNIFGPSTMSRREKIAFVFIADYHLIDCIDLRLSNKWRLTSERERKQLNWWQRLMWRRRSQMKIIHENCTRFCLTICLILAIDNRQSANEREINVAPRMIHDDQ